MSDKFVSKDYLDAKLEALEYKIDKQVNELIMEKKKKKKDIKYYAFVIIALMIILQPKVIDFISNVFSVSKWYKLTKKKILFKPYETSFKRKSKNRLKIR